VSTYATTEAAVKTLMLAYGPQFDDRNTAQGAWRVLDSSASLWACVLTIGAPTEKGDSLFGRGAQGKRQERHTINVEVYRKVAGTENDGVAYVALTALVDAIDAYLATYPRLNGAANVKRAEVAFIGDMENIGPPPPAAPTHLRQTLTIIAECEVARDWSIETPQ
jgi:hypothetical protein